MGIIEIRSCPVCDSDRRHESNNGIASVRKDSGRHYLQFAADKLGLTLDQVLDTIKVFQCGKCHSYYCDPWISGETASYIFTEGAPDHMAGWGNFEHWVSSPSPNAVEATNRRLYQLLEDKIGQITRYAEYGCPFQGFLLLFKGMEVSPEKRIVLFSEAIARSPDLRWTTSPRIFNRIQRLAAKLTVGYHRIRLMKETMRNGKVQPSSSRYPLPAKRALLTQETTKHWGNNCVRYGGSCSYLSSRILGADVLPFDERLNLGTDGAAAEFDLMGIFNVLDHTNAPIEVLRDSLRLARHIVMVNHQASTAGKQHLFAFHNSFPQWLASALDGAKIEDLSGFLPQGSAKGYSHILISRS